METYTDNIKLIEIKDFYDEAFRFFDRPNELIKVSFYPYVGINHTIRVREGCIYIRISETCRDMPPVGQRALAYILVAKLLRKEVPLKSRTIYSKLSSSPEIKEKADESRRTRGRRNFAVSPKGSVYDLDEIFDRINAAYFQRTISKPVLAWSVRKTYRSLGYHSSLDNLIVINKSFDDRRVPDYVVDWLMYHVMLHIYYPSKIVNGRRYIHTPDFRRDEEKFLRLKETTDWLKENAAAFKLNIRRYVKGT